MGFTNSAVVVWLQDCALWCVNPQEQAFDELFSFWKQLLHDHNDSRKFYEKIQLKVILYDILTRSREEQNIFDWLSFLYDQLNLKQTLLDSEMYPDEPEN